MRRAGSFLTGLSVTMRNLYIQAPLYSGIKMIPTKFHTGYVQDMYFTLKYVAKDLYRLAAWPGPEYRIWTPSQAERNAKHDIATLLCTALPELQLIRERKRLEYRLI
ncbi:MAG: hypothetical protein AMXMBFR84_51450 [Candidatus Hydrogenedentota bacterium]